MTKDLKQQIDELYNNPSPASLRQKWSAFIDSDSPGARHTRGTLVLPASSGLHMQTSQPWTVVLDQAGNPSTVILSEPPESRPPHSALFGR